MPLKAEIVESMLLEAISALQGAETWIEGECRPGDRNGHEVLAAIRAILTRCASTDAQPKVQA